MIEFFHSCNPPKATAQQRRHTSHGTFMPPNVKRAQAELRAIFEQHKPARPMDGPVSVRLLWTWKGPAGYKTTRPDLDNLAKLALDAMTAAGYWHDDSQVAELALTKYQDQMPGLYCRVEPTADAVARDSAPRTGKD